MGFKMESHFHQYHGEFVSGQLIKHNNNFISKRELPQKECEKQSFPTIFFISLVSVSQERSVSLAGK